MWESILHLRVCSESAVRCAYPFHTTHLLRMCDSVCRIAYACVCVFVFGAPVACTRCVLLSVCNRCCHNTRRTSISHWVRIELFFSVSSDISQWRRRRARYQQHNSTSRESSFIRFTFHYCSIYCSHSKPIICVIFAMLLLLTLTNSQIWADCTSQQRRQHRFLCDNFFSIVSLLIVADRESDRVERNNPYRVEFNPPSVFLLFFVPSNCSMCVACSYVRS